MKPPPILTKMTFICQFSQRHHLTKDDYSDLKTLSRAFYTHNLMDNMCANVCLFQYCLPCGYDQIRWPRRHYQWWHGCLEEQWYGHLLSQSSPWCQETGEISNQMYFRGPINLQSVEMLPYSWYRQHIEENYNYTLWCTMQSFVFKVRYTLYINGTYAYQHHSYACVYKGGYQMLMSFFILYCRT